MNNISLFPLAAPGSSPYYDFMFLWRMLEGMTSIFTIARSELYRYPYRQSAEAMRGDWKRIGKDIEAIISDEDEA